MRFSSERFDEEFTIKLKLKTTTPASKSFSNLHSLPQEAPMSMWFFRGSNPWPSRCKADDGVWACCLYTALANRTLNQWAKEPSLQSASCCTTWIKVMVTSNDGHIKYCKNSVHITRLLIHGSARIHVHLKCIISGYSLSWSFSSEWSLIRNKLTPASAELDWTE